VLPGVQYELDGIGNGAGNGQNVCGGVFFDESKLAQQQRHFLDQISREKTRASVRAHGENSSFPKIRYH